MTEARKAAYLLAIIVLLIGGQRLYRSVKETRAHTTAEAALIRYRREIPIGMTRDSLAQRLKSRGLPHFESCCWNEPHVLAMLAKVADSYAPWYCSEVPIYVVFEFTSTKSEMPARSPEDRVKSIHLGSRGEGCL